MVLSLRHTDPLFRPHKTTCHLLIDSFSFLHMFVCIMYLYICLCYILFLSLLYLSTQGPTPLTPPNHLFFPITEGPFEIPPCLCNPSWVSSTHNSMLIVYPLCAYIFLSYFIVCHHWILKALRSPCYADISPNGLQHGATQ